MSEQRILQILRNFSKNLQDRLFYKFSINKIFWKNFVANEICSLKELSRDPQLGPSSKEVHQNAARLIYIFL